MSKKKDAAVEAEVEESQEVVVEQVTPANVKVTVHIHGLEDYEVEGERATALRQTRSYIRARGLSVAMDGVEKVEDPGDGENGTVTYTFSEKCIADSGRTVKVPRVPTEEKGSDEEATAQESMEAPAEEPAEDGGSEETW